MKDNRFVHYFVSTYLGLFQQFEKYGIFVKCYFQTIFTIVLLNLFLKLFDQHNLIWNEEINFFFYALSLFNLVFAFTMSIKHRGFTNVLRSLYFPISDSKLMIPISIIISILQFFMFFIVKPIVMAARLSINAFVGDKIHHAISVIPYSLGGLIIIDAIKIIIYIIQAYIFLLFAYEIFHILYDEKH